MSYHAYSSKEKGAPLEKFSYEPKALSDFDIEVSISHCGVCHSDLHLIDNDWGISSYPLVPGHEIVGRVESAGKAVRHLKPGDRVGIGWQRSSCMICHTCMSGDHNLCDKNEATCLGHFGGFADKIRVDSRFALQVPDSLDSAGVAPLFCGGVTVFSPMSRYNLRSTHRVGVIGIGGLGHLALQYARAFGCEVFAFSSSPSKAEEAKRLGAHHFIDSTSKKDLRLVKGKLDFIISTVFASLDWDMYLGCLSNHGRLVFVGAPNEQLKVHAHNLMSGNKSMSGSSIGSPEDIRQMLEFSARHQIQAQIEKFPMAQVNEAMARLKRNQARYRIVLEN